MNTIEEYIAEAKRCLDCKNAPCQLACPAHNPIPQFMKAIKKGDFGEAKRLWDTTSTIAEICGRLCQNEDLCVGHCTLAKVHRPLRIGELEAGIADLFTGEVALPLTKKPGKHLVIGLGPAGIANALEMGKAGFSVDAIDANPDLGGALENLIPSFRFDKAVLSGIHEKFAKLEIKVQYNKRVGVDLFLADLLPLYDSIFVACGSDLPQYSDLKAENLPVYYAHDLLNRARYTPAQIDQLIGKNVVIIGLGNVAIDMARTLVRLHKTVTIVYRRTQAEAPAGKKEVSQALSEGIRIMDLSLPIRWTLDQGSKQLVCVKTKVILDENNLACVVNCEGEEFSLVTDDLIFATGQKSSDDVFNGTDIRLKSGTSPYATSHPKVFVGGDRINRNKRIVDAMVSGREVANLLKGV